MDYFRLCQDHRYEHVPMIEDLRSVATRRDMTSQNASRIQDRNIVFAISEQAQEYLDILDTQIFLVNQQVKKVIEIYDAAIPFKFFCILNSRLSLNFDYYAPVLPMLDALSPNSETNLDKSYLKKIVLLKEKIQDRPIFKLDKVRTEAVFIRLDVAESILRRTYHGYCLVPTVLE